MLIEQGSKWVNLEFYQRMREMELRLVWVQWVQQDKSAANKHQLSVRSTVHLLPISIIDERRRQTWHPQKAVHAILTIPTSCQMCSHICQMPLHQYCIKLRWNPLIENYKDMCGTDLGWQTRPDALK